jgi:hypothetical protein
MSPGLHLEIELLQAIPHVRQAFRSDSCLGCLLVLPYPAVISIRRLASALRWTHTGQRGKNLCQLVLRCKVLGSYLQQIHFSPPTFRCSSFSQGKCLAFQTGGPWTERPNNRKLFLEAIQAILRHGNAHRRREMLK